MQAGHRGLQLCGTNYVSHAIWQGVAPTGIALFCVRINSIYVCTFTHNISKVAWGKTNSFIVPIKIKLVGSQVLLSVHLGRFYDVSLSGSKDKSYTACASPYRLVVVICLVTHQYICWRYIIAQLESGGLHNLGKPSGNPHGSNNDAHIGLNPAFPETEYLTTPRLAIC